MRNAILSFALILGTSSLGADLTEDLTFEPPRFLSVKLKDGLVRIYTTRDIDELQKYLKEFTGPSTTYTDLKRALEALPEEDKESVLRELPPCPLPPEDLAKPLQRNPLQGSWIFW